MALVKGSASTEWIGQDYPEIQPVLVETTADGLKRVAAGKVDAFVGNVVTSSYYIGKQHLGNVRVAGETPYSFNQSMAVRNDWPILRRVLQKALDTISQPERDALFNRWMSIKYEYGVDTTLMWRLLVVAGVLFALILFWNNRLNTAVKKRTKELKETEKELIRYRGDLEELVDQRTGELKKLTRAMEQSPVSVVITDKEGCIEYVNPTFCTITGYTSDEAVGQNPRILKSGKQPDGFYSALWDRLLSGKIWSGNMINKKKNGQEFWERVSIAPLFNETGEITHYVAVKEDISDQKKLEQDLIQAMNIAEKANLELQQAKENAESANKAKSIFLANMSHEIRTPMNAILGHAQILRRDRSLNLGQQKSIKSINHSGEHLLSLINAILDMSKIEAGKIKLLNESFKLHSLLEELNEMFRFKIEQKELVFNLELSQALPDLIKADQGKVRQILFNLIGNAVKFTDNGGITLSVGLKDHFIQIVVSDTGCGIPNDRQATIFEAFEQTEKGMHTMGGTGLGLAISRKMANLMGGDIAVESTLGKGSDFYFTFEFEKGLPEEIIQKTIFSDVKRLKPNQPEVRVLIVDDRIENRNVAKLMLKPIGFHIQEAENGKEALNKFKKWKPQVVLMDIIMPVMDGLDATRLIKSSENGKNTTIIAVSASALDEEREKVLAQGADAFIKKPFRDYELFETIRQHTGIEYDYEAQSLSDQPHIHMAKNLGAVKDLPSEMLIELKKAAEIGAVGDLTTMINEVSKINQSLAWHLQLLVDEFELEEIEKILKY